MLSSDRPRRARRAEDKQRRRDQLLDAAAERFAEQPFTALKISDIAKAAGVAKGTVFIYFPTKEALFLELLERQLLDWLELFDEALEGGRGPWSSARVARLVADTLDPRTTLTRLLSLLSGVLEQNVEVEQIAEFKRRLLARVAVTGALLERRLPFLVPGQGARLMLQINALVVGVHHTAKPGARAREALSLPDLESLRVDFSTELRTMLGALLVGLEHAGA
ncbi:TetR family transcriptional regulator [Pseudenhygromyxa sp. WMMC2535]|uniref:TetR/AcrR family transcriptional regulator n=1 Tax=Pseudenhygromyxa sp. WMMC2535 TaxID=2712867 RepID=UPI001551C869|nr:TetR family transcriptional regulator [Pseudenhygromyxa sp. WMMC2535]NVB42607.1 TetR family transcriptional regulator [Pseudenhygromyxa sp. WMMC2535]